MSLMFSTKAGTLSILQEKIESAFVAPLVFFKVKNWYKNEKLYLKKIEKKLNNGPYIVRSSSLREDIKTTSKAGKFLSLTNVKKVDLKPSIEKVIKSYKHISPDDEVLVQPMLAEVLRSGVVFSHDPNTCSPYRIVNWSESNDTTFVTSGMGGRVWQQAAGSRAPIPSQLKPVMSLLDELLILFNNSPIDFEFAVTYENKNEVIWLLQVRQLILNRKPESIEDQSIRLDLIEQKVKKGMSPQSNILGKKTIYGVMPDWNPAEILGIRPKPLALSLYRELITDKIWAYQRHNYGYRNVSNVPLMTDFFGLPYVDVRISFNSFIPADLNNNLASRLVDYYLDHLTKEPYLHDKVEFQIVFSCYTIDLPQRLKKLKKHGFSDIDCEEIATSLRKITNQIANPQNGLWINDAQKINFLEKRRKDLLGSNISPLEKIYWLLEDAKKYGTLPFAGLARAGFMSIQMLKSFVNKNIISEEEYYKFLGGITTVSSELAYDYKKLNKNKFLKRYGHLRPGTYDILSPRYDEKPELYFDWKKKSTSFIKNELFTLNSSRINNIGKILEEHDLKFNPSELFKFMQSVIELRELAKFNFTHNLSNVLSLIAEFGNSLGIAREELAYSDISQLKQLRITSRDTKKFILKSIEDGKARYEETKRLSLHPLITKPEDIWSFEWPETEPNYITQKQVTALTANCSSYDKLNNAIVCIPNADPGFDWLFSYPIAGLVTAWGGANSHMAIRAGEIGLPAVIGVGEMLYKSLSNAERLHIDCAGRRIEIIL